MPPSPSARRQPSPRASTTTLSLPDGTAVLATPRPDLGRDVFVVLLDGRHRLFRLTKGKARDITDITDDLRGVVAERLARSKALAGDLSPLAYRGQHNPLEGISDGYGVEPVPGMIADADGGIGAPAGRTVDPLRAMWNRSEITDAELAAGEHFSRLFRLAQIDPLRAADLAPRQEKGGGEALAERVEQARRGVARALDLLGGSASFGGGVVWHILGLGETFKSYSEGKAWGRRRVNPTEAKGHLKAALGVLASHFGYGLAGKSRRVSGCGERRDFSEAVSSALARGVPAWGRREALAAAAGR